MGLYAQLAALRVRIASLRPVDLGAEERLKLICAQPQRESLAGGFTHIRNLAPRGWREMSRHDHFVQIYNDDQHLFRTAADYIADGLWQGDCVAVAVTPEHRALIERHLQAKGLDLVSTTIAQRYHVFDASETLAKFMVDDLPDVGRFGAHVGDFVRALVNRGPPVRLFGEMVTMLFSQGNRRGAKALEQLWNQILVRAPVSCFCAYPASCFSDDPTGDVLAEICRTHTRVIPPESYAA
jgi:hypothetical protein